MIRSSGRLQSKRERPPSTFEHPKKSLSKSSRGKTKSKKAFRSSKDTKDAAETSVQNMETSFDGEKVEDTICIKQEVIDQDEVAGSSDIPQLEFVEVVKHELKIEENEEDLEGEDDSAIKYSQYDHLLKNISICSADADNMSDVNSESEESSSMDEDVDDPSCIEDDDDFEYNTDDPANGKYDDTDEEDSGEEYNIPQRKGDNPHFSCFHCDFTCKTKYEFSTHLLSHGEKATLKCEYCDEVFSNLRSKKIHYTGKHQAMIKDKSLKHSCKFCARKFSAKCYLSDHIRATHTKETPYECKYCSKKFARRGGLVQHMQFHSDVRRFKCTICDAAFKMKRNREFHMRRHFGVKEFKCDDCGKDFVRKDQLKKHIVSVHKKKCMYKCSICNKAFKGHVLTHLRIHMNERQFSCKECGRSFVQSSQLTVHMRTHTGSKPYQCNVCKASFAHSQARKAHMLIHTGEKPYQCQLCSAAFKQLPHLKKHMRCIHKSDKPYVCPPCHEFFQTKAEFECHTSSKKCKLSSGKTQVKT